MKRVLKSFIYAFRGLWFTFRHEPNFQIESIGAIVVCLLCLWLPVTSGEAAILMLTIGLVLSMELANTAIERMTDILKPRVHPYARVVKDTMAGAVLIVSVTALVVGVVIFLPYFYPSVI